MVLDRSFALLIAASAVAGLPAVAGAEEAKEEAEAPRGHYIESAIPDRSSAFKSVSESTSRTFEKVESKLQDVDGRLAKMALSVGLAGSSVDTDAASLWEAKLDARSETFGYEFKGIQLRLDQSQVAYEEAFTAALERAVAGLVAETPGAIIQCQPKKASAMDALAGGGPGGAAKADTSSCPGTDFSQEIARRWDGDEVLEERLLEIVGGDLGPLIVGIDDEGAPIEYGGALANGGWPAITNYEEPGSVVALVGQVPAGATWLHPADLVISMPELAEALDQIDELADEARSALQEVVADLPRDANGSLIQDETTLPRIEAVQAKARGIRAFTEASRAELGGALWESLGKVRKKGKKGGWADVGLCLNPPGFGGCEGADMTDPLAEVLGSDKKLAARLAELREALKGPDVSVP